MRSLVRETRWSLRTDVCTCAEFVRIDEQEPLVSWTRLVDRPISLISEILKIVLKRAHVRARILCDRQGAIGAARIHKDDLVDAL